jgi:hypothetical protein
MLKVSCRRQSLHQLFHAALGHADRAASVQFLTRGFSSISTRTIFSVKVAGSTLIAAGIVSVVCEFVVAFMLNRTDLTAVSGGLQLLQ